VSNRQSRINAPWRWLIGVSTVVGLLIVPGSFTAVAAAANPPGVEVVYDPTGSQSSGGPVGPAFVAGGSNATHVSQVGMIGGGGNSDVWPVGQIGPSSNINLGQYVSVTVTPSAPIKFETLSYSKQSYLGQGPRNAAVRTSLDGFTANVANVSGLNPSGFDEIIFDLTSLPATNGQTEFRIYFFNTPATGQDWADLVSTNRGGAGLILIGEAAPPNSAAVPGWSQVVNQPVPTGP
jgi:hypothetical protein